MLANRRAYLPGGEMSELSACYDKDPDMVFRNIGGEMILVPIRRRTADLESIYTLNETGVRIWELIDGQRTLGEIIEVLVQEFKVTAEEAEADLSEFVAYLEEIQAVRKA